VEELHSSVVVAGGIVFGEGPRWHEGRLWFSDVAGGAINTLTEDGTLTRVVETEHPSGLGWWPDGTLVFSTLFRPTIKRVDGGEVTAVHDLRERGWSTNDLVVGPDGTIYVDLYTGRRGDPPAGEILAIGLDGEVRSVATGLGTPNGLAIAADRTTLVVSDTDQGKVFAFPILADGGLGERRVFADLGARRPDGLCLDAEGAAWVGCYDTAEFLRVRDGGEITHRIDADGAMAVATALGGADRRTLFLIVNEGTAEGMVRGETVGRVEQVRVDVPGAGWP
jgi:sugar lactone lactonase YvrE